MKKFKIILLIVSLIFMLNGLTEAAISARTIGLGDEFVTLSGPDILYANPAGFKVNNTKYFLEFNLAGGGWNNLLYNGNINQDKMDLLLAKIKDTGLVINSEGNIGGKIRIAPVVGFADVKFAGLARLSPDFTDLIFGGEVEAGKTYHLDGTAIMAASYLDTGVNFSWELPVLKEKNSMKVEKLYLGMTYHYLNGITAKAVASGSFGIDWDNNNNPVMIGDDSQLYAEYTDKNDHNATGSAFDLGVYAKINDKTNLGFSILNLGGSLTQSGGHYRKYEAHLKDDGNGNTTWEIDNNPTEGVLASGFKIELPLIIKLGAGYKLTDNLNLMANYTNTRITDDIFTSQIIDRRFALAAEYTRFKALPLRFGLNYSTLQRDFDLAAGFGLHYGPFMIDLGISDLSGLFNKSKGISGGITTSLQF